MTRSIEGSRALYFRDTSYYPIAIRTIAGTTATIYNTFLLAKTTRFARGIERERETRFDSTRPISFSSPRDNRVVLLLPYKCVCADTFKCLVRFPLGRDGGPAGGGGSNKSPFPR